MWYMKTSLKEDGDQTIGLTELTLAYYQKNIPSQGSSQKVLPWKMIIWGSLYKNVKPGLGRDVEFKDRIQIRIGNQS
jgi:hypothetical protein